MARLARQVKQIPGTVEKIKADGSSTTEGMKWHLLPPRKDLCQICAVNHPETEPHNAQSLYYQTAFSAMVGRAATWADAMSHCAPEVRENWKRELTKMGVWSEPPNGEQPVKHHGVDE